LQILLRVLRRRLGSNRRVRADRVGPDGICLDADGCIWASSAKLANDCARIREGREVLERIDLGRPGVVAALQRLGTGRREPQLVSPISSSNATTPQP
jgi:hypothetical protein